MITRRNHNSVWVPQRCEEHRCFSTEMIVLLIVGVCFSAMCKSSYVTSLPFVFGWSIPLTSRVIASSQPHSILFGFPSLMVMYQPQIPLALRLYVRDSLAEAELAVICKFSPKYLLPFWNVFTCRIAWRCMFVNAYLWLAARFYSILQRFILHSSFIWSFSLIVSISWNIGRVRRGVAE